MSKIVPRNAWMERVPMAPLVREAMGRMPKDAISPIAQVRLASLCVTEIEPVTKKRGRPVTENPKTNAQRQKAYRERRKAAAIVGRTET